MTATLDEARAAVERAKSLPGGTDCPCCGQRVQVYKRKLNSSMAQAAIALARNTGAGEWVHLFDFLQKHGVQHSDAPMLRHWGIIEERGGELPDGNPRAGWYRITDFGRGFARGTVRVAAYARTYNQQIVGWSGDTVDVRQALGKRFNYAELIEGT